jgi:hypothetical protein
MEKPNPSLNVETKSKKKSILPKRSMMDWEPDEDLKKAIVKSWGLENNNERPSDSRSR